MIIAIGMCKDEADVIERTLFHLVEQGVDEILLLENASMDGTWEIVRDLRDGALRGVLNVLPDHEVGYYQADKMTRLAHLASASGADWIIPFDADELWIAPDGLASFFASIGGRVGLVRFPNYNHYRTSLDPGGHPFDAMIYRTREPLPLPKVAVRARASVQIDAGNHNASGYRGLGVDTLEPGVMIHHYPYRSVEQFIRKARNGSAAYAAASGLPRSTGQHWREWGDVLREHGEAGLRAWFDDAFYFEFPAANEILVADPVRSRA